MVGFFFNEDVSATGIVGFIVLIFDFCLFKAIYRIETMAARVRILNALHR